MELHQKIKALFLVRSDTTFLNFGSFGACPKPIFEDYQRWQLELETDPVQFITVKVAEYLKQSREALGKYLNCDSDDLVFMVNPTYAVNTVAKSLKLEKDDEILTTNLEYGACDRTWDLVCEKAGAKYIRQNIQLPLISKEQFISDFFSGVSSKTKLIFISHITSATGLIFPVEEICKIAKSKGILTFVDGAHAPGHIQLDLEALNADFYTGACHKWMMTPKGSSFLIATKEAQKLLQPLAVSWGYKAMFPSDSMYIDHHQLSGTRDYSAYLTIPKAIAFMEEQNWALVKKKCHELVIQNAPRFCQLLGTKPLAPLTSEFFGQMFSIPIRTSNPEKLHRLLVDEYRIEIPVARQEKDVYLRYSIQGFNSQQDLDILYEALVHIIKKSDLIHVK